MKNLPVVYLIFTLPLVIVALERHNPAHLALTVSNLTSKLQQQSLHRSRAGAATQPQQVTFDDLSRIEEGIVADLTTLENEAKNKWNSERKKGSLHAGLWLFATLAIIGSEVAIIAQNLSTEGKLGSAAVAIPAALKTAQQFLDTVRRVIKNEDMETRIQQQLANKETVEKAKEKLAQTLPHPDLNQASPDLGGMLGLPIAHAAPATFDTRQVAHKPRKKPRTHLRRHSTDSSSTSVFFSERGEIEV